jgi:hypothetical protein
VPVQRAGPTLKENFFRIPHSNVSKESYFPSSNPRMIHPCTTHTRHSHGLGDVLLRLTRSEVERNQNIYTKHAISAEIVMVS